MADSNMTTPASNMMTPAHTGKKLGIKRVKKKQPNLNISKGNLKSVSTPKNFSFLNVSVQKQSLRANNRALAQNLAKTRQELRNANSDLQELRTQNQELTLEVNKLKRVAGLKDGEIDQEVQKRMQKHMLEMRVQLEELTQNMLRSSSCITTLHDKCLSFGRRSTASSRALSIGNESSTSLDGSVLTKNHRSMFTRKRSDILMSKYLSRADEFAPPPMGDIQSAGEEGIGDMSVIAEQSILDDGFDYSGPLVAIPITLPLTTVSENMDDVTNMSSKNIISKLPQRVLKTSGKSKSATDLTDTPAESFADSATTSTSTTNLAEEPKSPGENATMSSNAATEKSAIQKPEITSKKEDKEDQKNKKKVEKNGTKEKDNVEVKETKSRSKQGKTKAVADLESKLAKLRKNKKEDTVDSNPESDVSAFGFGGDFAEHFLVSGSPIMTEKDKSSNKRRETFDIPSVPSITVTDTEPSKTKTHVQKTVKTTKDSSTKVSEKMSSISNKSKSASAKSDNKSEKLKNRNDKGSSKNIRNVIGSTKTKTSLRETNPFKPQSNPVVRSPEKVAVNIDETTDPFKPTKNLLRSPLAQCPTKSKSPNEELSPPVQKVDSLAFLATMKGNNSESRMDASEQPSFPDEPTMYFDAEMEFTSVINTTIDVSKLTNSLKNSDKRSPAFVPQALINEVEVDNQLVTNKTSAKSTKPVDAKTQTMKEKARSKKSKKQEEENKPEETAEEEEAGSVEMRTKKPGEFIFTVGRKEADGSRKAVPEKISKARSKRKKNVTPEKDSHRTGEDRDMFNFGDRTPTMTLDKLIKPANAVYDMSMNESGAAQPLSLNDFRERLNKEKVDTRVKPSASESKTDNKPDEHVYYLPMPKGSPEEKPVTKRSRSQSRTRSKSKTRKNDDSEDEDWEPKQRSKSRSRSVVKSRESNNTDEKEDTEELKSRGRSKSKTRTNQDSEDEDWKQKPRSKSRSRSTVKSKTSKEVDEVDNAKEQRSRARSRTKKSIETKNDDDNANIKKRQTRSKSKVRNNEDVESENDEEKVSKSVSQVRKVIVSESDESPLLKVRRSVRSKSRPRYIVDSDTEDSVAKDPEVLEIKEKTQSISILPKSAEEIEKENVKEAETLVLSNKKYHEKVVTETSDVIYHLPLKGSPECPNVNSRSRSRSRSKVNDLESNDFEQLKVTRRSKSRTRSIKIRDTEEETISVPKQGSDNVVEKVNTVEDNSDSDFIQEDRKVRQRRKSRKSVRSENIDNVLKIDNDIIDDSFIQCAQKEKVDSKETKAETITEPTSNNWESKIPENFNFDSNSESDKDGQAFNFVTKKRGQSAKIVNKVIVDSDDDNEDYNKLNTKTPKVTTSDTVKISKSAKGKSTVRKAGSKSVKSLKKSRRSLADDIDTPKVKKDTSKHLPEPSSETSEVKKGKPSSKREVSVEKESLPSKTPVTSKSTSSHKSEKVKTQKTERKRKADTNKQDDTPKGKPEKSAKKTADKENDKPLDNLARLKRRLSMVVSKNQAITADTAKTSDTQQVDTNRKRTLTELKTDDDAVLDCDVQEAKRARRTKTAVSYAEKPLNVKMRRGDTSNVKESPLSKAKAEKFRLLLTKKTTVSKPTSSQSAE